VDLVEIANDAGIGYFTSGGQHLTMSLPYFRRKPELLAGYRIDSLTEMYGYVEREIQERDAELKKLLESIIGCR